MSRVTRYQVAVIGGFVLLLEALCVVGVIDKVTMPPPHRIAIDFVLVLVTIIGGRIVEDLHIADAILNCRPKA